MVELQLLFVMKVQAEQAQERCLALVAELFLLVWQNPCQEKVFFNNHRWIIGLQNAVTDEYLKPKEKQRG